MIKRITLAFTIFIVFIIIQANLGNNSWFSTIQRVIPLADKLGHLVLVGCMTLLLNLSLGLRSARFAGREWLTGSLIIFFIFTVEELTQLGLVHRTFDLGDLSMDYLGIFIFGRIARLGYPRLNSVAPTAKSL